MVSPTPPPSGYPPYGTRQQALPSSGNPINHPTCSASEPLAGRPGQCLICKRSTCCLSQSPWEDWQPPMRKRLRACAACPAGTTGQLSLLPFSRFSKTTESYHMPMERKAVTAALTNPYSPLWVLAKVPSLGSSASPFSGRFPVPSPATSVDQILETKPFMSA